MKVFIVLDGHWEEDIIGVYDSEQKAINKCKEFNKDTIFSNEPESCYAHYEEWDVE